MSARGGRQRVAVLHRDSAREQLRLCARLGSAAADAGDFCVSTFQFTEGEVLELIHAQQQQAQHAPR